MDFKIGDKFWGRCGTKPSNILSSVGGMILSNEKYRQLFLKPFYSHFPLPNQDEDGDVRKRKNSVSHESYQLIEPVEMDFFIPPNQCKKISLEMIKQMNNPLLDFLSKIIGNSLEFFEKDENLFDALVEEKIIQKMGVKITFNKDLGGSDSVLIMPSESSLNKKEREFELYHIPDKEFLGKWRGSPSIFLECVCYQPLSSFYEKGDLYNNVKVYRGELGNTGNNNELTEFDFIVKKKVVVLCSVSPTDSREKSQVEIAKQCGYKVLFVTDKKGLGKMNPDDAILEAFEKRNFGRLLIEKVEKLALKK